MEQVFSRVFRHVSRGDGPHHPVNSYYFEGPDGAVWIDPAADVAPDMRSAAQILVTHLQVEQVEGARNFPEVPLWVPSGDKYLCEGREAYENLITAWEEPWDWDSRGNFRGHVAGARNERPTDQKLAIAGTVKEGEVIAGLRVVSTPGHGKNAVTYLAEIEGRNVAFCGDLICGDGQLWNWFDAEWDYGLQGGQKALLSSAKRLLAEEPDILLPAHGEPIFEARAALETLVDRLSACLSRGVPVEPINFPEPGGPEGWRQLSPHLYQWKTGNCALLVSKDGVGLLVDDGLCNWAPLGQRRAFHREVVGRIKRELGITRIEQVLVTHYHGDHVNDIPYLLETEPEARVGTLDLISPLIEDSRSFNLSAPLWWYGGEHDTVPVHHRFANGEVLRWREYELEVFHLGGQTFYHCGVSADIDGARVLFVGDALYGWDVECEPILAFNDNEPTERGWAYAVDRMLERAPELAVCGHGSAISNPVPLLQIKQDKWREKMVAFDALNYRGDRRAFFDPSL